jgi:hypothetical protein
MHPIAIVVPLLVLVVGVTTFLSIPMPPAIRGALLAGEVAAAVVLGIILARKYNR